jgi:hypothetical protein
VYREVGQGVGDLTAEIRTQGESGGMLDWAARWPSTKGHAFINTNGK